MNRNRTSSLALMLMLMLSMAGCINLPDIDPEQPDTPAEDEPLPDLSVRFQSPQAKTYTNGGIDVSVEVTNGTAETVDLFAGDELLATLTGPYTYHWDTTQKPEGSYTLTAKARRGAQSFASEAREVVVDRTPPEVILVTPEAGSKGVRASHAIQAVLSEALNPGSATLSAVRLKVNGSEVAAEVSLSSDGKVLTLVPAATLSLPAKVEVVLTEELRDAAGNSVIPPAGGWSWDAPDFFLLEPVVEETSSPPGSPSMQLDMLGNPVVAYVRSSNIYVRRWTGSAWESLGGSLNVDAAAGTASGPLIQLDAAGKPVVAWSELISNGRNVYVKRWTGSAWESVGGALSRVPDDVSTTASSFQLDASGNPIVLLTESDGQARNGYVYRWIGASWEMVGGTLSAKTGTTHVGHLSLRVDSGGNPVVAWLERGDNSFDTAYVSRWSNGQWVMLGSVLGANPGGKYVDEVSLALDSSGTPVIAIHQGEINVGSSSYLLRWTGDQWSTFTENLPRSLWKFSLQMDVKGRPIVVGLGGDGNVFDAYVMRWMGVAWEQFGGALDARPGYSGVDSPVLQLKADEYPVVAWSELDSSVAGVYVAYFNY